MTGPAFDRIRTALEHHGRTTKTEPFGLMAQCPAHDDGRPSMSMRVLPGRVKLHCFAGCEDTAILAALGLSVGAMFDEPRKGVEYQYGDGRRVHRGVDKSFRQSGNTKGAALYVGANGELGRIRVAVAAGEIVYLVEGEQDADAASMLGAVGVSAAMGAGNFAKADVEPLRGANVVVVPDQDEPGAKWLDTVRARLTGVVTSLTVRAPLEGKDLTDHYAAGHGLDDLVDVPETTAPASPSLAAMDGNGAAVLFDRDGLRASTVVQLVQDQGPIARGPGGLYAYVDGVWTPAGPEVVRHRVHTLLGERGRKHHADTVVDILASKPATLTDADVVTGLLNLPNGLLDWRTGQLMPHTPDLFVTPRLPIEWDPTAECPAVTRFLGEVFGPDAVDFALEVVGYCLLNDQPMHKAVLLYGRGRNGKGTFLRLLKALLGEQNVCAVTPQELDADRFAASELHGNLANLVGDVDPKIFTATETFKQATGGDMLRAQKKYGQPFKFTCRATIVAAFNALPRTSDGTEGFFSRWLVVPMPGYFPAGVADLSLDDKLQAPAELRGLLRLAVEALARLMARGRFDPPASVLEATAAFRDVADPIRTFLADVAPEADGVENGEFRARADVYQDYQRWAEVNGYQPYAAGAFYERLEAAGAPHEAVVVTARKRQGTRGYLIYGRRGTRGSSHADALSPFTRARERVSNPAPAAPSCPSPVAPAPDDVQGGSVPGPRGVPTVCAECRWPTDSVGHQDACGGN